MIKSSKNVLFLMTSKGFGGLEMNCLKMIKALDPFYSIHVAYQSNTRFAEELKSLTAERFELKKVRKYFDFKSARILAEYIKVNEIETVITMFRPDIDLIAWTKKKVAVKHVHHQNMQIGIPKKGIIHRFRYQNIDAWIAPLNWLKEEVIEKTFVKPDIIHVVPIGVDTNRFLSNEISKEKAREKFNLNSASNVLGVLGRFDEKKAQLFVIQALNELLKNDKSLHLLLVGEPTINDPKGKEYYEQILKYIEVNNLSDYVSIAPFTKEIEMFYKAIDVFVMSSVGETYGMVTLEALLSGTPVIGTNSGGTPELLSFVTNSTLYEVNNLNSFVDAFKKMQFSEGNNKLCSQIVKDYFSVEKEIEGWIKTIDAAN